MTSIMITVVSCIIMIMIIIITTIIVITSCIVSIVIIGVIVLCFSCFVLCAVLIVYAATTRPTARTAQRQCTRLPSQRQPCLCCMFLRDRHTMRECFSTGFY